MKLSTFKNLVLVLVVFSLNVGTMKAQAWQWAKNMGGSSTDGDTYTCTDPSGNVFMAGYFGSASINIGTITINNTGTTGTDVFISKYDANGNVLWAQRIGGTGSEFLNGICSDASGRVYVTGAYNSPTLSIAPFQTTNGTGQNDVWVACFDGLGSPIWLKAFGGANGEGGEGLVYSNSQNALYLCGEFGSPTISFGATTLTNSNNSGFSNDIFLVKLTSTGNVTWAIRTGGPNSADNALSLGLDASNQYPYIGGTFSPPSASTPTTVIGTTILTTMGNTDVFIAKYSDLGTFQWAHSGGSTSSSDAFTELTVDASNNCYIAGSYFGASLVIGSTTLPNQGSSDAFIAKYNSGGTLQWAKSVFTSGNTVNDDAQGITCDASGNIYVAGSFGGTVVTNAAGSLTNTTAGSSTDVYVTKFNSSGIPVWNTSAQGTNYETGRYISSDAVGNLYVAGSYNIAGPITFGSTTLNSAGGNDGFLAKIGCLTAGITGPANICIGSTATLTATGATSYTWSTGATTSSIVITPTANTNYSVTGASGACVGTPGTLSLTVLPASLTMGGNLSLLCKQKAVINATCSPSATLVTWSPTVNLSSSSVLNPTVTGTAASINYTVSTTLNNGCVKASTINVSTYAQTPDICQVTVDSLGNNNEIYWEKTLYPQADSFIVYRETAASVYTRIAGISRTAFSMYTDTNRSTGGFNGDPNLTYYRYKLQIKDSCGNVSALSKWHETIFVQDQLNGNFNWNAYAIELSASPVSSYNLKRRDLATGTETLVLSTGGNLGTDPNYATLWTTNIKWFVDAIGFNCVPSIIKPPKGGGNEIMVIKTKTKSNQSNDKQFATKVPYLALTDIVKVYPNPANEILNLDLNALPKEETYIEIRNAIGQIVYQTRSLNQFLIINTNALQNGVYFVDIKQEGKAAAVKKVVIGR